MNLFLNRRFLMLWSGQTVSIIGDWIRRMSLTFWVYQVSGHSPMATAGMAIAESLPALLIGPLAGVFVSRWSLVATMFWARVISTVFSVFLIVAVRGDALFLAYVIGFFSSMVSEFYYPARQAMVPAVVQKDEIVAANSLSQTSFNLALVMGPIIGTAIFYSFGAPWSMALDAFSFAAAAALIKIADLPANPVVKGQNSARQVLADMREGIVYMWRMRSVFWTTIGFSVAMFAWGINNVIELFLITRNLGLPESRFALSVSAWGLAMIALSMVLFAVSKRVVQTRLLVTTGLVLTGCYVLGMGFAPAFVWVLLLDVVGGFGNATLSISTNSLLQTEVEAKFLPRVFGVYSPVAEAAMLFGTWAGGFLARHMDVRPIFMGAGVVILVATAFVHLGFSKATGVPKAPSTISEIS